MSTRIEPALLVEDLAVVLGFSSKATQILRDINLEVGAGRTIGLVGESGSGKSTLARAIVGTVPPAHGRVLVNGRDLSKLGRSERAVSRRAVQLIPQDPYSSLSPRRTIGQTLAEAISPIRGSVRQHRDRIGDWLTSVQINPDTMNRYPHEFSGGQRQRIAIARALLVEPQIVIADEITSALDVLVQAEILALLGRLKSELNLTMLFISHNLAVVRGLCDEVAVLHRGDIVEHHSTDRLFTEPQHPYTRSLLASVPGSAGFTVDPSR